MEKLRNKAGFTLVEVVIVMAIIAALALLVVGAITVVRQQSRDTQLRNDAKTIKTAIEAYNVRNKSFPSPSPLRDRDAYSMTLSDQVLSPFLTTPLINPSQTVGNKGAVCYNLITSTPPSYYRIWVVTESKADACSSSCTDPSNVCSCGMVAACSPEIVNDNNY